MDTHTQTHINRVRATKSTQFNGGSDGVDKCCCFSSAFFFLSFVRWKMAFSTNLIALKTGKALIEVLVIPTQTEVYSIYNTPVSCIATLCYCDRNISSRFFHALVYVLTGLSAGIIILCMQPIQKYKQYNGWYGLVCVCVCACANLCVRIDQHRTVHKALYRVCVCIYICPLNMYI